MSRTLALALSAAALAATLAAWLTHNVGRARLDALLAAQRQAQVAQLEEGLGRLQAAQRRGDELTHALAARERAIEQLTQERRHALTQTTSGVACLSGAALRVLDQAAGISVAALPAATSSTAAADAAVATDTDLALWTVDAGGLYEQCRSRLQALIDWHGGISHSKEGRHDSP